MDIQAMVMARFPKTASERSCKITRDEMRRLRENYRKKLENEQRREAELREQGQAAQNAV